MPSLGEAPTPKRAYLAVVPPDSEGAKGLDEAAEARVVTLGSISSAVAARLAKAGYRRLRATTEKPWMADVIFAGPSAAKMPWKQLSAGGGGGGGGGAMRPLVNFYRGFECVCRKGMLVRTLRHGRAAAPEYLPESFLFTPGRPELSEVDALRARHADLGGNCLWILKPSDGGKGERISIMRDVDAIAALLEARPTGSIAWVVSRYLEDPLLLNPGGRKFDVRVWVLLNATYDVLVWRRGVLRTCSVPFSLDDASLGNAFVHLSNHCIQAKSAHFGAHESNTNELAFRDLDDINRGHHRPATVNETYAPQWNAIIFDVLAAARETLEVIDDYAPSRSFQVFGFDFMIDGADKVWLVEVNSSPAIADHFAADFAADVHKVAIDAYLDQAPLATALQRTDFLHVTHGTAPEPTATADDHDEVP